MLKFGIMQYLISILAANITSHKFKTKYNIVLEYVCLTKIPNFNIDNLKYTRFEMFLAHKYKF